ncbi:phospho-N-acetylmuramoyl-pentapeptide-transferase [Inconstantimicrobium mannanitabidum]|uniref:Phospho-N-acetylmuramoyl-pentapeptide-transferase n=1 Tax=Inconstantimicrobium mannanitabidum TaxID=1604901 RepID=A0ACB5RAA5_9CLOT|nr:phospho-N-acetylmuramoyl-pentapeptide-transferase [Clostridium sp. TW13]GKX66119.1 phospho-N-acetylmuramoyl-pentapeptide-transferase [Clostridium sp. TW13]
MDNSSLLLLILTVALSFLIASIIGPFIIPMLRKLKFGQNIRDDGPKTHLKKAGTPTIGGIIFILSTTITVLVMIHDYKSPAMVVLFAFIAFGFVGFLDDILKIIHKKNLGLRAWQKMVLLFVVSSILTYYAYSNLGTEMVIPFAKINFNFGILFIPIVMVYLLAFTNAVNLTDGLDGLCTSITILVLAFFAAITYKISLPLCVFSTALIGGLLGFLRFNAYPAKVFMGDTGSLALGGAVAAVAMLLKAEWILVIVGGIYVIETLSVVIQVTSFKLTGKRVFKMAPIHHHFEQLGWNETKIVSIFSIITVLLCFLGFLSL